MTALQPKFYTRTLAYYIKFAKRVLIKNDIKSLF